MIESADMLTECPSCQTIFRVTPAILKMGHGQVRCGKCRTQFDAIECMLEEDDPVEESGANEDEQSAPEETFFDESRESGIESDTPSSAEEITMEGGRIEISGTYRIPDDESDGSRERIFHEHVVIDRGQPDDDISVDDLSADEYPSDELDDDAPRDHEPYVEIEALEDANDVDLTASDANDPQIDAATPLSQRFWKRRDRAAEPHVDSRPTSSDNDIDAALGALAAPPRAQPERTKLWSAVIAVCAIALIAQIVHHNRDPLVRDPKWGGVISRVYHVLGLSLTPNWDLSAFQLQQWGVVSDSAARDVLRIRASVTNAAAFSQPYPHIKLALEDRFGAVVAMREFAPQEYLPSSASANRMMAPRQRANAEIAIVDPGADAVGFFIDACLPSGGNIVCFRDVQAARK